jgi:four helix bundle protein
LRRAVVSVTSNIAEGFGRVGVKEKDQFYSIASGSLSEVESQLLIAIGVGYITKSDFLKIEPQVILTHKLLHGLRKVNKQKDTKG